MSASISASLSRSGPGAHVLERQQIIPLPRAQVFAFFSDAANLERITPPSLRFHILTPRPIAMQAGAVIDYRLRISGVPVRWRTVIEEWEPGVRFVDVQARGPYLLWRHTHEFADAPGGGTLMRDRVEYRLPLGPLGALVHALFVRRQVQGIFDYRRTIVGSLLAPGALGAAQP